MGEAINGNLSVRAVADTTLMEWVSSPSGSVWRKRWWRRALFCTAKFPR